LNATARRIQTDNGASWGCAAREPLTPLGVWRIRLDIRLSHSRPLLPQSNGKDERFHRSLKAEVLAERVFADLANVQTALDRWRTIYNQQRPMQAAGCGRQQNAIRSAHCPFRHHCRRSKRVKQHRPQGQQRRMPQLQGTGAGFQVSKALTGAPVALRPQPEQNGGFDLSFCHQKVDSLDLVSMTSED
jgi:hypothetical protein